MNQYFQEIWQARYFWSYLALSDLKARWRRSFFGILWSILQPVGITVLIAIVFSQIFHSSIRSYAPYILSGIIIWDLLTLSVTHGSLAFVQSEPYIKQCRHPLAIYTLRTILMGLIILGLTMLALLVWVLLATPENFGWCWLSVLTIFPILLFIAWPLSTILAYVGARFRDLPYAMTLVMQGLWFISPVYFEAKVFRQGRLHVLVDYNPIYHLLQIVRAPLLEGHWPTLTNYLFVGIWMIVMIVFALIIGKRMERATIFYL